MRDLYPEIEPVDSGLLDVGDGHQLYYEDCGARGGIPVVFLHGGPGSGAKPQHRQLFDPKRYRIIVFDQRGSGRSQPHGRLEANTTAHLLADMEVLRGKLSIDRWLVLGGSWGATLALLYAETHPQRLLGLILRGTFLARAQDYQFLLGCGAERFFPEYWQDFRDALLDLAEVRGQSGFDMQPESIIRLLHEILTGEDTALAVKAAEAWGWWSGRVVTYTLTDGFNLEGFDSDKLIRSGAIELHYARQAYFIDDNQLLNHIERIPEVPVRIIHGRRDMICTLSASWDVHQRLPQSELRILENAGHLGGEPAMIDALIEATDSMAERLPAGGGELR